MKHGILPLIILLVIGCGSDSKGTSSTTLSSFTDSVSYSLGADLGENLKTQNVEINYDLIVAGLTDGMETGVVQLNPDERRKVMTALQKKIRDQAQQEGSNNLVVADEFLAKNKSENSEVKETPTGLQYRVIQEGEGNSPIKSDIVKVHYVGRLMDGSEFDSSIKRGEPSTFGLTQVIKGWTEGLQLMNVGSKFEFYIHPKLAYGPRPRPSIPGNSLLIFEVELLEIIEK